MPSSTMMQSIPEFLSQKRAPRRVDPCGSSRLSASISQSLKNMEAELARVRPLKDGLRRSLDSAITHCTAPSLQGCVLEVVGSTSWGGDVPHSDLDVVLLTPRGCIEHHEMVVALEDLRRCLEASRTKTAEQSSWLSMELLHTARVPILRLHGADGLHCDVSVDQHHALVHRDFMNSLSSIRPEVRSVIRLVKMWLYRRGLPVASDGGLPSLAWSLMALRFVQAQPEGTPIELLLSHFFKEMQQLGDHSLCVRRKRAETGLDRRAEATGSHFEWSSRDDSPASADIPWIQLVTVEDPTQLSDSLPTFITQPSMPAALGVLYISELRLAWHSIAQDRWHQFWQPAPHMPVQRCMMGKGKLHVVLRNGEMHIGQLREIQSYPRESLSGDVLHRRDQTSKLSLQLYGLQVTGGTQGAKGVVYATPCNHLMFCHPCDLVCALPTGPAMLLLSEGVALLSEIIKAVGTTKAPLFAQRSMDVEGKSHIPDETKPVDVTADAAEHKRAIAAAIATATALAAARAANGCIASAQKVTSNIAPLEMSEVPHPFGDSCRDDSPECQRNLVADGDVFSHCEPDDESTCLDSTQTSDSEHESYSTRCTTSQQHGGERAQDTDSLSPPSPMSLATEFCSVSVAWKPTLRHWTKSPATAMPTSGCSKEPPSRATTNQAPGFSSAANPKPALLERHRRARCSEYPWRPMLRCTQDALTSQVPETVGLVGKKTFAEVVQGASNL